ncbi:DUF1049 domain-containing protein [bacterium]|nr:DUF1049 domain-containing protein [bacterium]
MNLKLISIGILFALIVLFIFQNVAMVEIQFLFWSAQIPRSLLMFLLLALGILIGWLLHAHYKSKNKE